MEWRAVQNFLTQALSPSISAIIIALLFTLTLPLLTHLYIYRTKASTNLPAFLLVGPSGAGKTSLLTLVKLVALVRKH